MSGIIEKMVNIVIGVDGEDKISKVSNNIDDLTTKTNKHTDSLKHNRKGVLESGGAMGLLGAATGGLAMDFKDAIEAVGDFGISLKGVRGALISTGIGIFAVVLLELIGNWDKWSKVIDGSADAIERLNSKLTEQKVIRDNLEQSFKKNISSLEEELRLEEALNGESAKSISLKNEINTVSQSNSKERLASLAIEIASLEEAWQWDDKRLDLQREIAVATASGNKENIARASSALLVYQTESEIFKKLQESQKEKLDTEINLNKLKNDPAVETAEKARLAREKAISLEKERQKKLQEEIDKSFSNIEKNLITIEQTNNAIDEQYGLYSKLGSFFKEYSKISSVQLTQSKLLVETLTDINKLQDKGTLSIKDVNRLKELKTEYSLLNEEYSKYSNFTSEFIVNKIKNQKFEEEELQSINDYTNSITDLNIELSKLQNSVFEYQKVIDGSAENSNRFDEIESRINKIYEKRLEIIDKIASNRIKKTTEELDELKKYRDELNKNYDAINEKFINSEINLSNLRKANAVLPNEEFEVRYAKEIEENRKLEQEVLRSQASIIDNKSSLIVKEIELNQISADTELQIKQETADKNIAIEENTLAKKKELREEDLQRQREYYDMATTIANNASDFLSSISQGASKKDKRNAEIALRLRQASGIASVHISGMEERQGIRANPTATSLPDFGVSAKSAMIAGSWVKEGLAVATILSQKINTDGGSGGNGIGGGDNAQAQFNIVGSSANNQLASSIATAQNQPVNAFVVGSDVSTQQALDRNRITTATFL